MIEFLVAQYIFESGFIRGYEVLSSRQNCGIGRPQEKVNGFYVLVLGSRSGVHVLRRFLY